MKRVTLSTTAIRALALSPVMLCLMSAILQLRQDSARLNEDFLLDVETEVANIPSTHTRPQAELERGWATPDDLTTGVELPKEKHGPKIAFASTTAAPADMIKVWMRYHRSLGVSLFYLFTNGQVNHPSAKQDFERFESVKVFPNDEKMKHKRAHSRAWNETWLASFFNKPCNHELFVMQSLNMEVAIEQARQDGVDWLFHIDTDELIYPAGTAEYSLQQYMASLDKDVDTVIFPNYEGLAEREDVIDPFTEVTLFKKNFAHVSSEPYFKNYKTVAKGNPNYFTTYGNGKSAVRVQPKVRPNGAHRWYIYGRKPKEVTADQSAVLHFIYNRYEDLKGRRDRCDCAPTEEDVKRCFILPFDRAAFIASSLMPDDELRKYFRDHLVWSNGQDVTNLMKEGLLARVYTPQAMVRVYRQLPDMGLEPAKPGESKLTIMDSYTIPP
ncbi:hypothetical protein BSKO_07331 [Bryopsis sp. KO-2023]|nr:hypothetical protein BSKO_07331 [Bryopsis sp. KO-2023]